MHHCSSPGFTAQEHVSVWHVPVTSHPLTPAGLAGRDWTGARWQRGELQPSKCRTRSQVPWAQGARSKHHSQSLQISHSHSCCSDTPWIYTRRWEKVRDKHRGDGGWCHWEFFNFCFTLNGSRIHLFLQNYSWGAQTPQAARGQHHQQCPQRWWHKATMHPSPQAQDAWLSTAHSRDPQSPPPQAGHAKTWPKYKEKSSNVKHFEKSTLYSKKWHFLEEKLTSTIFCLFPDKRGSCSLVTAQEAPRGLSPSKTWIQWLQGWGQVTGSRAAEGTGGRSWYSVGGHCSRSPCWTSTTAIC